MASEAVDAAPAGEEESYVNVSRCLILESDDAGGTIREAVFNRESAPSEAAAKLLGLPAGERLRAFHCPMFERAVGWSVHLYVDLQGLEHKLDHNTNATQLWLIANLPGEPPEVSPDSIHGPVLLTAEDCKTEDLIDLTLADWKKLVAACTEVQPNAAFSKKELE